MTIELDENSYIVGMWFSSTPKSHNDWLGCAIIDPENPLRYKGWSRFRHANSGEILDNDDDKCWTTYISHEGLSEEDVIRFMELAQNEIIEGFPDKDCLIVRGNLERLIELSDSKPWLNMKQVRGD